MSETTDFLTKKSSAEVKELVKSACKILSEHGEEAFFVSFNPSQKETDYVGSHLGCAFLSNRLQILDDFYGFCLDVYGNQHYRGHGVEVDDNSSLVHVSESSFQDVPNSMLETIDQGENMAEGIAKRCVQENQADEKMEDTNVIQMESLSTNESPSQEDKNVEMFAETSSDLKLKPVSSDSKQKSKSTIKRGRVAKSKQDSVPENYSSRHSVEENTVENASEDGKRKIKQPKWVQSYMMENNEPKTRKRSKEMGTKDNIEEHKQNSQKTKKKFNEFMCGTCGEVFEFENSLNSHVCKKFNKSNKVSDTTCTICNKTLSNKTRLKNHIQTVHKIYDCDKCSEKLNSVELYNQHLKTCDNLMKEKNQTNSDVKEEIKDAHEDSVHETKQLDSFISLKQEVDKHNPSDNAGFEKQKWSQNSEGKSLEKSCSANLDKDIVCQECSKSFRTRKILTQHLRRLHKVCLYLCHCMKSFNSSDDLKKHRTDAHNLKKDFSLGKPQKDIRNNINDSDESKTTTEENSNRQAKHTALAEKKTVKCELCDVSFTIMKNLKRHMKNIHNKKDSSVFCDDCGKGFEDSWKLKYHLRNDHKYLNIYKCESCPQSFHTPVMYRRHIKECDGKDKPEDQKYLDSRTCRICLKVLLTEKNLELHLKSHVDNPDLVCKYCQKTFVNPRRLKDHYEVHKKSLDQKFPCPHCNKAFLLGRYLLRHINDVHKEKVHVCKTCGAVSKNVQELSEHILQTHGPSDPNQPKRNLNGVITSAPSKFICETCGKIFKQKIALKNHSAVHGNERPYRCDKCGLMFKSLGTLSVHKRYRHRTFKAYQCELCGECFKMPETLRCHRRTHDKPKYNCEFCDKEFRSLDGFKYHMLLLHKTDQGISQYRFRIFKCDFCEKMFGHKSNYDYHIKTHTGARPFKCDHCEKAFPVRSKLNLHMRRHTGEKIFTCETCNVSVLTKTKYNKHLRTAKHKSKQNIQQDENVITYQPENIIDNTSQINAAVGTIETDVLSSELKIDQEEDTELQNGQNTCIIDMGQQTESYVISVANLENPSELVESLGRIYQHEQAQVMNQPQNQVYDQGQNLDEVEQIIEISIPYHVLPATGYSQTDQEAVTLENVTLENVAAVQGIQE